MHDQMSHAQRATPRLDAEIDLRVKAAWGEVGKQFYTELKLPLLPPFLKQSLLGEITVPMATQLIAQKWLWLWMPWQHVKLHYTVLKSSRLPYVVVPAPTSTRLLWHEDACPRRAAAGPSGCHGVCVATSWTSGASTHTALIFFCCLFKLRLLLGGLIPCCRRITALAAC